MKRYLIALALALGIVAASVATAQPSTEDTTPTMSFTDFKPRYQYRKDRWHSAKVRLCRPHAAPHRWPSAGEVAPAWRDNRLSRLHRKIAYALSRSSACYSNPVDAIRYVFGAYAPQALTVGECESHVLSQPARVSLNATNGQYVGVFQMGHSERKTYGWYTAGARALVQVRSAHRYFVASGLDWSPWECRP